MKTKQFNINRVLITDVECAKCVYVVISLNPFEINPEPSLANFPCPILRCFVCTSM